LDEIRKTLSILKSRWLEAVLIIGLLALSEQLIYLLPRIFHPRNIRFINMSIYLVNICVLLFVLLITGGFLRTVYLEQKKRQSLLNLIRIGNHFFSRLFRFRILYAAVFMFWFGGLYWISQITVLSMDSNIFRLVNQAGSTIIKFILAKPILLVPALIIVGDCDLFKSFGFMRQIRLLKAKPLLAVFLVQIVLSLFFQYFHNVSAQVSWHFLFYILRSVILQFLSLSIQIMAVNFVGSSGIECNREQIVGS
jgi:hypothetical protein